MPGVDWHCGNCAYSIIDITGDEPSRECRRFPPMPTVVDEELVQSFPLVEDGMWCGEWKAEFA